jgi:chromosome segregation ATPase
MLRWTAALNEDADRGLDRIRAELLAGLAAERAGRALYRVLTTMINNTRKADAAASSMRRDLATPQDALADRHPEAMALAGEPDRTRHERSPESGDRRAMRTRLETLTRQRSEAEARLGTLERDIGEISERIARAHRTGEAP